MSKKLNKNSFIQGTLIASICIILVKILGALYVIPFYKIIGEQGGTLYSYAYTIYNLFLNISTAGIPIALSMIVSELYTKKMFEAKERSYNISKKIITFLSIFSFVFIFLLAKPIAAFLVSGNIGYNNLDDIALVIRAISFCLLITPFLSAIRGYLQGHKFISSSSYSQIIEQVIRIIIVLLGSYLAVRVFNLGISIGVAISLTGAFFGALFAYIFLKIKISKNKESFPTKVEKDNITNKEIIKMFIKYCIPLILTAIVANLYDTIDLKLIIKGLNAINYDSKEVELIASIITTWSPKICVIITAVSTGLVTSLIPHIISGFVKNDIEDVNNKFNQAISILLYAIIPMTLAIIFLSSDIYYIFYGYSVYGPFILKFIAIVNCFFALLTVLNTVLQGVKNFKLVYINTFTGLIVNTILDIPLIYLFNSIGITPYIATIISSIIGNFISISIVIVSLKKKYNFNYSIIISNIKRMVLPTITMILILSIRHFINIEHNMINSIIIPIILGGVSCLSYLFITYKNGLLKDIIGIKNIKIPFIKKKKDF